MFSSKNAPQILFAISYAFFLYSNLFASRTVRQREFFSYLYLCKKSDKTKYCALINKLFAPVNANYAKFKKNLHIALDGKTEPFLVFFWFKILLNVWTILSASKYSVQFSAFVF